MADKTYNISLEELTLKNFRCFKDLSLSFEEQLTVIIAENGGGKTAVLEAIAGCLRNYLAILKVKGYKITNVPKKDVTIGAVGGSYSSLSTEVEFTAIENYEGASQEEESEFVTYEDYEIFQYSYSPYEKVVSNFRDNVNTLNAENIDNMALPVLVYFGGESVKVDYNSKLATNPDKLQIIYQNALEGNRFAFTHFYNWWKSNEDRMLRMSPKSSGYRYIDNQFKKIQTAVEYLMNDDGQKPTYRNLRINEELKMGMDKFTYDENGNITNEKGDFIEVSQFSAGEKSLFAYVADLGLRLLHANPIETSAEEVGLHVFKGRGVALIDEVGLHLHPKWQQKVIGKLLDIFPEMQFVVTTHSPLVLLNVKHKVYKIGKGDSELKFGGWPIEEILEYMGVRETQLVGDEYNNLLKAFYDALDNENLESAEKNFELLIKYLKPGDSEIAALKSKLEALKGEDAW